MGLWPSDSKPLNWAVETESLIRDLLILFYLPCSNFPPKWASCVKEDLCNIRYVLV